MNKTLIALMVSLTLAGCSGGSSEKNTAAEPPAPQMPSGDGGGNGNDGEAGDDDTPAPEVPVALAMDCAKQPGGSIASGTDAKATFKVNKAINSSGTLTMNCPGGNTLFGDKLVDIISGQALVKQSVPAGCEGSTLNMTLTLSEENLSATCSWPVNETLVLGFGG